MSLADFYPTPLGHASFPQVGTLNAVDEFKILGDDVCP